MQPRNDNPDRAGLKEQIGQVAESQKERGAARLNNLADIVHGAALELEKEMPRGAKYVHGAASKLEVAAEKLRTQNADELLSGLGNLARRQPVTFFGGALLAGFAISRFLKSSSAFERDEQV